MPTLGRIFRSARNCQTRGISLAPSRRHISTRDHASVFANAKFVAAAGSTQNIPKLEGKPEVRRANSGKSSLFNAVVGRKDLLHTSSKPGRTKELNFYSVGPDPGHLVLVDAPGYGARGRPEWGELFDHYISTRTQLRRIYILFNAKHDLNEYDRGMLAHLSDRLINAEGRQPFTLQAIITKVDSIPSGKEGETIRRLRQDIFKAAPLCMPPLLTSVTMHPPFGVGTVRSNIIDACGL
ncbi:hypothetical protein HDZ31DRAFT_79880 [Schizophyllum fasciatum]